MIGGVKWLCALVMLLWLTGCGAVQVRTSIEINANPEAVFAVLSDFKAYPVWNPYHVHVEGALKESAILQVHIKRPDGEAIMIAPHILRLIPNRELSWGGGIKGIFWGEHVFILEPINGNRTRLIHNEDFNGVAVLFADLPPDVLTKGYRQMNRALKRHVESSR